MEGSQERIHQEAAESSPSGGPQPGSRSSPISMIKMDEEHFSSRNLQEGVDEVHKELKDPVERSETRDVDVDVTDVADGKVRQLESASIGDVHLDDTVMEYFQNDRELLMISC